MQWVGAPLLVFILPGRSEPLAKAVGASGGELFLKTWGGLPRVTPLGPLSFCPLRRPLAQVGAKTGRPQLQLAVFAPICDNIS